MMGHTIVLLNTFCDNACVHVCQFLTEFGGSILEDALHFVLAMEY